MCSRDVDDSASASASAQRVQRRARPENSCRSVARVRPFVSGSAFGTRRRRAQNENTRFLVRISLKILYCASEIKNRSTCDRERTAYDGAAVDTS